MIATSMIFVSTTFMISEVILLSPAKTREKVLFCIAASSTASIETISAVGITLTLSPDAITMLFEAISPPS